MLYNFLSDFTNNRIYCTDFRNPSEKIQKIILEKNLIGCKEFFKHSCSEEIQIWALQNISYRFLQAYTNVPVKLQLAAVKKWGEIALNYIKNPTEKVKEIAAK